MDKELKIAAKQAARALYNNLPTILGIILLVSLINTIIPKDFFLNLFYKNIFIDSFVGSAIGSILAGTPITSYILGGELLSQGISLTAVTAFLVAWVTVGLIQLPAESIMLGKKFATLRNIISFVFSIIVAILTVIIMEAI
jgi:uncharacterized membrane protein YraQ (UPF0718 family)